MNKRKTGISSKSATAKSDSGFPAGVARPALRALAGAGYSTLDQLTAAREEDLLALHGMGPNAMKTLRGALAEKGKRFRR